MDTGVGYGKQVIEKIETSDNSAVKYARGKYDYILELAATGG